MLHMLCNVILHLYILYYVQIDIYYAVDDSII